MEQCRGETWKPEVYRESEHSRVKVFSIVRTAFQCFRQSLPIEGSLNCFFLRQLREELITQLMGPWGRDLKVYYYREIFEENMTSCFELLSHPC